MNWKNRFRHLAWAGAFLGLCAASATSAMAQGLRMSSGSSSASIIDSEGNLWAWGYRARVLNQPAAADTADRLSVPYPILVTGLPPLKDFSTRGNYGNLPAVDQEGDLWVFKSNTGWEEISTGGWESVYSSYSGFLALKEDGTLWGFGRPDGGDLGIAAATYTVPVQSGTDTWLDVDISRNAAIGVQSDGTLWEWGQYAPGVDWNTTTDPYYVAQQVGTDSNWVIAEAGATFSLAIKEDGGLYFWGNTAVGSYYNTARTPQLIDAGPWVDIAAGTKAFIAVRSDGSVWGVGQMGLDTNNDGLTGKIEGPSLLQELLPAGTAVGQGSLCAAPFDYDMNFMVLKADGSILAWGRNDYGQLGLGFSTFAYEPTLIDGGTWDEVHAGGSTTAARNTDGSYWVAGETEDIGILDLGYFGYSYSGYPYLTPTLTEATLWQDWAEISTTSDYFLAIDQSGNLWHWGNAWTIGASGYASYGRPTLFADNLGGRWVSVSAGNRSALAVREDGTLWGIGNNSYGQLGNADATHASVFPLTQIGTDTDWVKAWPGQYRSIALKSDGSFWFSGENSNGTSGDGTTLSTDYFIQMAPDHSFDDVWMCASGMLGRKADGSLWAWGRSTYNDLLGVISTTPVLMDQGPWAEVAASYLSVAAIKGGTGPDAGTLWSWGLSEKTGQGGDIPYIVGMGQVGLDSDWAQLSGTNSHYLAIREDGSLWGWGTTSTGVLGLGIQSPHTAISQVSGSFDAKAPVVNVFPPEGGYVNPVTVTIGATDNVAINNILYTTDGTDPAINGLPYTGSFVLSDDATVRYYIDDAAGNTAIGSLFYQVNLYPVVEPAGPFVIRKNSQLTFAVNANDPDGDQLSYAIGTQGLLGQASVDATSGLVTYKGGNELGFDAITVRVTDNGFEALSVDIVVPIEIVQKL